MITESLRTAKQKYLNTNKINDTDFTFFKNKDKSKSFKYVEWMIKQFVENNYGKEEIVEAIKEFEEALKKNKLKQTDINKYETLDELVDVLEKVRNIKSNTELKKEIKREGVEVWYEDDKWLVVKILTWEASKLYGAHTKWCTTEEESDEGFKKYTNGEEGDGLVYFLKKGTDEKWAGVIGYTFLQNNTRQEYFKIFFDPKDKYITEKDVPFNFLLIQKHLKTKKSATIEDILEYYHITNSTINRDGSVDVDGNVALSNKNLKTIPIKFGKVTGNFYCSNNQLTTLEGAPQKVVGDFYCYYNQLTTLEGAPQEVGGDFNCSDNQLTTLEGAPQEVEGNFYCIGNQLTTLKGAPQEVGEWFDCSNNPLTTLEGAPQEVGEEFKCNNTQLTTLEGAPQKVGGWFDCSNNLLITLEGAPQEVGGIFNCNFNKLITLKGAPQKVGRCFWCTNNQLITLEGAPQEVGGDFKCNNNQLITLEGAPQKVVGWFEIKNNNLEDIEYWEQWLKENCDIGREIYF